MIKLLIIGVTVGLNTNIIAEPIDAKTWNHSIDEILIDLDKVKKESHMFPTIGGNGYPIQYLLGPDRFQRRLFLHSVNNPVSFNGEQKRLITLARNTESLALVAVAKLRSQQFPKSDVLENQIKLFTSNYCSYLSRLRFYWEKSNKPLPRFNGWREEAARRRFVYQNKKANQRNNQLMSSYIKSLNVNLNNITQLKIKTAK